MILTGKSDQVIPLGSRFSAPVDTGPGAHPASCTMGTGSFPGVKSGRGVTLTPHPLLVPWSRKGRAITLLPLWAVRPVQSLSASTRVHKKSQTSCALYQYHWRRKTCSSCDTNIIFKLSNRRQQTVNNQLQAKWRYSSVGCVTRICRFK